MKIRISAGPTCPRCGAQEVANPDAPISEWKWQIRAFKVHHHNSWWSECMPCKDRGLPSWFNERGRFERPTPKPVLTLEDLP